LDTSNKWGETLTSGFELRREIDRINRAGTIAARQKETKEQARKLFAEALEKDVYACQDDWDLLAESPRAFRARVQLRNLLRLRMAPMARDAKVFNAEYVVPEDWTPKIFVYWGQGFENAPEIVRFCHAELHRLHNADDIVVLTDENLSDWVELPPGLREMLGDNRTAFSDVLRFELLAKHGGIWIDATCLPTVRLQDHFDELVGEAGFFAFETKEKTISSWFLASRPGHYLTHLVRDSLRLYWRVFDRPVTYFYLHFIFQLVHMLDRRSDRIWSKVPRPAYDPRTFGRVLKRRAEDVDAEKIVSASIVHKLSYKPDPADVGPGTVFHELVHGSFLSTSQNTAS